MSHSAVVRHSMAWRGFTLIEVILSIMILALGIVSVQRVFVKSLSSLSVLENWGQADRLLEEKIWELGNEVRDQGARFQKKQEHALLLGIHRVYQYNMNIRELSPDGNLMEAQAVVSWGQEGINRSIKRTFYLRIPYASWKT